MNRHLHRRLRRNALLVLSLLAVFALTGISRSTPPLLRYHDFHVRGNVQRAGGPGLEGYTVGLFYNEERNRDYRLIVGVDSKPPLTITSDTGGFTIRASTHQPGDSLKTGVILPGDTIFSATAFAVADVPRQEMIGRGETASEGGCDSPETYEFVEGYLYHQNPEQLITVPQGASRP